jgi:DNA-binding LacI/PurR family transcriptional regulator
MSIIEIAKKAGVSKSTVSRVLNNHNSVSPVAAAAVKHAAKKLNYQMPVKKRGPKNRKELTANSNNIVLLNYSQYVSDIVQKDSTHYKIILGIEKTTPLYNMNLIVAGQLQAESFSEFCPKNNIRGIILVSSRRKAPENILELMRKIPTVIVPRYPEWNEFEFDCVTFDNLRTGRLATEYFLEKGHKAVAFLNISPKNTSAAERCEEFSATALACGMSAAGFVSETNETDFHIRQDQVDTLVDGILKSNPRITGLFVAADAMAIHVYNSLKASGVTPMKGVEIITCDNVEAHMAPLIPKPVVIDTGFELIGESAVNILNWKLNKPNCRNRISMKIDPVICGS